MATTGNPYLDAAQQTTAGNVQQAQAATAANRINQNTPYANLSYTQSTDANGNPVWTANQSLNGQLGGALNNIQQNVANNSANPFSASPYQAGQVGQGPQFNQIGNAQQAQGAGQAQQAYGIDSGQQAQGMGNAAQLGQVGQGPQFAGIGNAGNLQTGVAGTGMQGWDAATNLLMSRLSPQMAQDKESQNAALANQGIVPGTQAYNNAMRTFNQGQNDLVTQAQLQGSQVQNQMFNQNLAAGQFGNQAVTQQNSNQLANLGFNNQLGQQGYQNQLAGTQANNAALTQQNSNQLANLGLSNSAIAQNFGQGLQSQQLQNQAAQQNYSNQLAGTQLGNQAAQQNYTNQLAGLGFNNATGQQGFSNQLAGTQANNAAQAQNFTQNYNAYNSPLQQLGAFQSGTQPGYVNPYTQATVAGPDYLGAYSTQNAQAIAAQNAANAKTANTQSGLYGLGGAALLGGGGLSGLLGTTGTAATAGTGLLGLGSALTGAAGGINNWWNNLNFGSSGGAGLTNGGVTGNSYDAFGNLISSGNAAPAATDWTSAFGGTGGIDYSDIRMKENIELIGQLPSGLNVYNFEYKPEFKDLAGHGAFTGVMAQEAEKVIPKAVVTMPNGYKAVNYSLIN